MDFSHSLCHIMTIMFVAIKIYASSHMYTCGTFKGSSRQTLRLFKQFLRKLGQFADLMGELIIKIGTCDSITDEIDTVMWRNIAIWIGMFNICLELI